MMKDSTTQRYKCSVTTKVVSKSSSTLSPRGSLTSMRLRATYLLQSEGSFQSPKLRNLHLAHIYGHKDDNIPASKPPFEAQINIKCDSETKECTWTSKIPLCRTDPIEGTSVALYLGNYLVTTNSTSK